MYRTLALSVLMLAACKGEAPPPPAAIDAGQPEPPPTTTDTVDEPLVASGIATNKGGDTLEWRQPFDAGRIHDLAFCGGRLLALGDGGRVVEWNPQTLAPRKVATDLAAIVSIDGNSDTLLAAAADGRLLLADCDGGNPDPAPNADLPPKWVQLDPRSKSRAFVAYEEVPTPANKYTSTQASIALVDLQTGHAFHGPYRTPWPEGATPFGFTDYRGELWFGLNPHEGPSRVWYFERFDPSQPHLQGLRDSDVMRGFVQISREVWAYGGSRPGPGSFIYRVDSNRAQVKWDGQRAWFGERPGGDIPEKPIVAMVKRGKNLVVVSTDAVYRVDPELRRWARLPGEDTVDDVLATATAPLVIGDTIFLGTAHGLVSIGPEKWSRGSVPDFTPMAAGLPPVKEVRWKDHVLSATDKGLSVRKADSERSAGFKYGPRKKVQGMHVDGSGQLWVFAADGVWVLSGLERGKQMSWDARPLGLYGELVTHVGAGPRDDAVSVLTSYGGEFTLAATAAPPKK